MLIDFSPVRSGDIKLYDFAKRFTLDDLRAAVKDLYEAVNTLIEDASDAQMVFLPYDPHANDPHAIPGEERIGWSLAHLVVHVTASAEEGAAVSSLLARGIPYPREPRLRYETNWKTVLTKAQAVRRLRESRRIVLAYLDTWPDEPHLNVYCEVSERFIERNGLYNAPVGLLSSLMHMDGHLDQFRDVLRQAQQAPVAAHGD